MKSRMTSKEWGKFLTKKGYKIRYKKKQGDPSWMFEALGWKQDDKRR